MAASRHLGFSFNACNSGTVSDNCVKFFVQLGTDKKKFNSAAKELNNLKFKIPKIFCWGWAHRAPSPDSSPALHRASPLNFGFALKSRALRALNSGFAQLGPPNF